MHLTGYPHLVRSVTVASASSLSPWDTRSHATPAGAEIGTRSRGADSSAGGCTASYSEQHLRGCRHQHSPRHAEGRNSRWTSCCWGFSGTLRGGGWEAARRASVSGGEEDGHLCSLGAGEDWLTGGEARGREGGCGLLALIMPPDLHTPRSPHWAWLPLPTHRTPSIPPPFTSFTARPEIDPR